MKRIIPALAFLGMIFSSDDLFACELKSDLIVGDDPFILHSCVEVSPEHKKTLDETCISSELDQGLMIGAVTAVKMASCPEGAKKVCESKGVVWYYYNDASVPENCE